MKKKCNNMRKKWKSMRKKRKKKRKNNWTMLRLKKHNKMNK